jgi:cytidyltransferase-like protein
VKPSKSRTPAIALYGGVFDPIHAGHLAVGRAARRQFGLDAIHYIPSGRPPHKAEEAITAFEHRYAMVALACAGEKRFFPSLAEADPSDSGRFFYTIVTVGRFRRTLAGASSSPAPTLSCRSRRGRDTRRCSRPATSSWPTGPASAWTGWRK